MPYKCSAPGCHSNYTEQLKARVFSFPKDEKLKEQWLRAIPNENFQPSKSSKICEKHFKPEDILTEASAYDSKNNLTITAPLKVFRLKPDAIPSIFFKSTLVTRQRKRSIPKDLPLEDELLEQHFEDTFQSGGHNMNSDDQDDMLLEEVSSEKVEQSPTSSNVSLPSPYKNLPTVSVCLKQEDRILISKELQKGVKRSPSVGSNSSNGSNEASKSSIPPVKRKKVDKPPPSVIGRQNDCYCWVCHKENIVLCCIACPRAFHQKCAGESEISSDWVCPECRRVIAAENVDTRSSTLSDISLDKLCALLKYSLNKLKYRAPAAFHQPVPLDYYSSYPEYVIHPMDLSLIERNIKQKLYGCTEAFLADMKWIVHNSCVFNGTQHPLSTNAKSLVKTCEYDMQEIEVCPDCFLHGCVRSKYWFSEVCRKPHPLVWAKLKGFPYWPAKVVRILDGNVDARFFGAHDRAWVSISQCYHLSKEMPSSSKPKKKGTYETALDELNVHVHFLKQQFGVFEYAPYRTSFDTENKLFLYHGIDIDKIAKEDISLETTIKSNDLPVHSPITPIRLLQSADFESEKDTTDANNHSFEFSKMAESNAEPKDICNSPFFKDNSKRFSSSADTEKNTASSEAVKEGGKSDSVTSNSNEKTSLSAVESPLNSDAEQLKKLEMALERIKGYINNADDTEKQSSEGDATESDKPASPTPPETPPKVIKDTKTKEIEIDFPSLPIDTESSVTEAVVLNTTNRKDSFFLKLNETIESCKAKLGISEIVEDQASSGSESVEEEEGENESENSSSEDEEEVDESATSSSENDETNSDGTETDVEDVQENMDQEAIISSDDKKTDVEDVQENINQDAVVSSDDKKTGVEDVLENIDQDAVISRDKKIDDEDVHENIDQYAVISSDTKTGVEDIQKNINQNAANMKTKSCDSDVFVENSGIEKESDICDSKIPESNPKASEEYKTEEMELNDNKSAESDDCMEDEEEERNTPESLSNETLHKRVRNASSEKAEESPSEENENEMPIKTLLSSSTGSLDNEKTDPVKMHSPEAPENNDCEINDSSTAVGNTTMSEDFNPNDEDEDSLDIYICNSPPEKKPDPPLICLDDGTENETDIEDKTTSGENKTKESDLEKEADEHNNSMQTSLGDYVIQETDILSLTQSAAKDDQKNAMLTQRWKDGVNRAKSRIKNNVSKTHNSESHTDERSESLPPPINAGHKRKKRAQFSKFYFDSASDGSDDEIQTISCVTNNPLSGAKRTFRPSFQQTNNEIQYDHYERRLSLNQNHIHDKQMSANPKFGERIFHDKPFHENTESDIEENSRRGSIKTATNSIILDDTPDERLEGSEIDVRKLKKKLTLLTTALQRQHWRHTQEKAELRHNMNLIIMEMRASLEADKKHAIEALSKQHERDKVTTIAETKKKQWCASCNLEARYACCWNTSYCTPGCQKRHFAHHMKFCGQILQKTAQVTEVTKITKPLQTANTEPADGKPVEKKIYVLNVKSSDASKISQTVTTPTITTLSHPAVVTSGQQKLLPKPPQIQIITTKSPFSSTPSSTPSSTTSQIQVVQSPTVQQRDTILKKEGVAVMLKNLKIGKIKEKLNLNQISQVPSIPKPIKVLLSYNRSAKVREIIEGQLIQTIKETYGLNEGEFILQKFDNGFKEYVDLEDINSIKDMDKIKIVNCKVQNITFTCIPSSTKVDSSSLKHSSTSIKHSSTSIEHSSTSIKHSATSIEHSSTSIEHSSTSIEHSSTSLECSSTSIEHSSTSIEHPSTSFEQSSTSLEQSSIEHPSTSLEHSSTSIVHPSTSDIIQLNLKSEAWPLHINLPIQNFSSPLLKALQNEEQLSWTLSSELVTHLATFAYKYTPYPNKRQREEVCRELVFQYPYLKSQIGYGIGDWEIKILNKLKRMRQADNSLEVKVNRLSLTYEKRNLRIIPHKELKRKRGINFLIDHVEGENETTLESHKKFMAEEFKKSPKSIDVNKIDLLMALTYSFRRQWIAENGVAISKIKKEYPFLFETKQQFDEMQRLQNIQVLDILNCFLLENGHKIIVLYRTKNPECEDLKILTKVHDESLTLKEKNKATSIFALLVLPRLFNETQIKTQSDEIECSSPLIEITSGDVFSGEFTIIAEGIELSKEKDFITIVALMFCFYFSLNLEYPKRLRNTLLFIQNSILKIATDKIPPKVITFHNKLNSLKCEKSNEV